MNPQFELWLLAPLLCFCRVGSCFMLVPGIASDRVPIRFRLTAALALSMVVGTAIGDGIAAAWNKRDLEGLVVTEVAIGLMIGLLSRSFFAALNFAGALASSLTGLTASATAATDEGEPVAMPADFLRLAAVVIFFALDLHLEVVVSVVQSYEAMPPGSLLNSGLWLHKLTKVLSETSRIAVQLTAPLVLVTFTVNLVLGVANRMLPMIPMQFLGAPVILGVGLLVLLWTADAMLELFVGEYAAWLRNG